MAYRGIENPYKAQLLWRQVSHNCYPHDTEQRLTLSEPWWPLAVAHLGMFVTLLSVLMALCRSRLHMRPLSPAAVAQLLYKTGSLPMVMGVAQR